MGIDVSPATGDVYKKVWVGMHEGRRQAACVGGADADLMVAIMQCG